MSNFYVVPFNSSVSIFIIQILTTLCNMETLHFYKLKFKTNKKNKQKNLADMNEAFNSISEYLDD